MLAVVVVGEDFHYAGVVQLLADLLFTVEAFEENRVGFHLGVRNFDCHSRPGAFVRGAEDRGHAATFNQVLNQVMVEFVAGAE